MASTNLSPELTLRAKTNQEIDDAKAKQKDKGVEEIMDPQSRTSVIKTVKNQRKVNTNTRRSTTGHNPKELIKKENSNKLNDRPITDENGKRPISKTGGRQEIVVDPAKNGELDKSKKFVIGAPSNYDKMKKDRDVKKVESKQPKIYEPPNPGNAFETMLKRSKGLREFFEQNTDEDFARKYMSRNWHFLTSFEAFQYQMVKLGEITKEFNNLNKATAKKIDNFIIEKVNNYMNFSDLDKQIKTSNNKMNKALKEVQTKKTQKKTELLSYFQNFES